MRQIIRLAPLAIVLCLTAVGRAQAPPSISKVLVIGTGGTIAVGVDAKGTQRRMTVTEVIALLPPLKGIVVEEETFGTMASSAMTPELQFKLARRVADVFKARADLAGIVITHGTDSMEESAFLVDLIVADPRPVVFVGALRSPSMRDSDGPRNLENAIRIAVAPQARDRGVLLSFNDEIHSARFVTKSHTIAVDGFQSGRKGILGTVDTGTVIFYQAPLNRVTIPATTVEPNVDLVRLTPGDTGKFISSAAETKAAGLVVEAFGRGTMAGLVVGAIESARRAGVIVVLVSRVPEGRIDLNANLADVGVIAGEGLDGLKARVLLTVALGATKDIPTIQRWFRQAGGVTPQN